LAVVAATALLIARQHASDPVYVRVPSQTLALVRQFAQADGNAQVLTGPDAPRRASARYIQLAESDPARISLTSKAARSVVATIAADRRASLYTKRYGISWDSAHIEVKAPRTAARMGDSLTFVATITWWLHINGRANADSPPRSSTSPSMDDYSATAVPYIVGFTRTPGGSWLLASIKPKCPPPQCV